MIWVRTLLLPRCPGETGIYLGLTGTRIAAADLVALGIAKATVPSAALDGLETELAECNTAGEVDLLLDRHKVGPGKHVGTCLVSCCQST